MVSHGVCLGPAPSGWTQTSGLVDWGTQTVVPCQDELLPPEVESQGLAEEDSEPVAGAFVRQAHEARLLCLAGGGLQQSRPRLMVQHPRQLLLHYFQGLLQLEQGPQLGVEVCEGRGVREVSPGLNLHKSVCLGVLPLKGLQGPLLLLGGGPAPHDLDQGLGGGEGGQVGCRAVSDWTPQAKPTKSHWQGGLLPLGVGENKAQDLPQAVPDQSVKLLPSLPVHCSVSGAQTRGQLREGKTGV